MSTELTTTDFQQLDQLDEQQIVAELQGALLDQYVYSFKSGGRQVVGLSWAGVKAVANKLGPVACDLLELRDTDESYICVMKASAPDGTTRIGAAEQPKTQQTKRGEQPDPFALPKAVSKAQRNAIRALLPETLITEMVKAYRGQTTTPRQQPARKPKSANGKPKGEPKTAQEWVVAYEELARKAAEYGIEAPAIPEGANIAAVRRLGHELKQQYLASKRAVETHDAPS